MRRRASVGQAETALRARRSTLGGSGLGSITGYPHSSRAIASGSSSAQAPWPAQSIGLTRSFTAVSVARTMRGPPSFLPLVQGCTGPAPSKRRRFSGPVLFGAGSDPRDGEEQPRVGRGAAPPLVQVDLGGERLQCAADEPDRAVGVVAGATS